jgi:hypothetical protein
MIKSIIVVSMAFSTISIPLYSYAQEPVVSNSHSPGHAAESASLKSSAFAAPGDQTIIKTPTLPFAKLLPYRDPVAQRSMNSDVVPPTTPSRQEAPGIQHEFHGEFSSTYTITNGVPR